MENELIQQLLEFVESPFYKILRDYYSWRRVVLLDQLATVEEGKEAERIRGQLVEQAQQVQHLISLKQLRTSKDDPEYGDKVKAVQHEAIEELKKYGKTTREIILKDSQDDTPKTD